MRAYALLATHAPFRRFWLALLLVMLADEIVRTTLVWQTYAITRSPQAVGLLMVCLTGPIVVSGLLAGWLLDRYPRARVMAADGGFRTLVFVAVAALTASGVGGVAPLYLAAAVQGALLMVLLAGAPSAIAELVEEGARPAANALEMVGYSIAIAVGPFLAGLLIAHAGAWVALALAAGAYATFCARVAALPIGGGVRRQAQSIGLRESGLLHPAIVVTTIMFAVFNIGTGWLGVWMPLLTASLGGSATLYGSLLAVAGVGQTAGALAAGSVRGTAGLGLAIAAVQVLAGLVLLPLAAAPSIVTAATAALLFGAFSGPMTVWAQTIRMRIVAPQWRGRAFATLRMIMQSGRPLGGAIGGEALALLPLGLSIVATGLLVALPALAGALHPALRKDPAAARVL
jgi:MFS family permease